MDNEMGSWSPDTLPVPPTAVHACKIYHLCQVSTTGKYSGIECNAQGIYSSNTLTYSCSFWICSFTTGTVLSPTDPHLKILLMFSGPWPSFIKTLVRGDCDGWRCVGIDAYLAGDMSLKCAKNASRVADPSPGSIVSLDDNSIMKRNCQLKYSTYQQNRKRTYQFSD